MMKPEEIEVAKKLIIKHEDFSATVYIDTCGNPTFGYGHAGKTPITKRAAMDILNDDLLWHVPKLHEEFPFFKDLTLARKAVLIDMSYNLGFAGLLKFEDMLSAIANNEFKKAAEYMLDSVWFEQVKNRALEDARIMRTGEF